MAHIHTIHDYVKTIDTLHEVGHSDKAILQEALHTVQESHAATMATLAPILEELGTVVATLKASSIAKKGRKEANK
jgi:hypothetical protein